MVNEDEGNCEVWKLGGNCDASRNYPRGLAVGQGRDAQGGRCLPAVLGIFVHGSRPLESGGKGTAREGWQGERGVGGRGRNRAARSYRRQSKCNYPPPM